MREYLAVATRPAERNGLGLKLADALANVRAFRGRTSLLAEDGKVADRGHGPAVCPIVRHADARRCL